MTDSQTLLRLYATQGSEAAFGELVSRYVNLVYSTAVRLVDEDAHRAEDVVQTVFADLARRAGTLSPEVMLGGWLHRRTCHVAATLMRSERRRQHREQQALQMNALVDHAEARFEQIAPMLDQAINQLSAPDRAAIVLRFFEGRDLQSVGQALASSDDAAQKRVSRALEKLRGLLRRQGVALSAGGLATLLATHAVTAAPAGLAASASAAALAAGAAATGGGITMTVLKMASMAKLKIALGTVVVAGLGTTLVLEQQAQEKLRTANQVAQQQAAQVAHLTEENERLSHLAAQTSAPVALSEEQMRELLRLRGEVGVLRRQQEESKRAGVETNSKRAAAQQEASASLQPAPVFFPRESWSFAGYADPDSAFQSGLWAHASGDGKAILSGFSPDQQAQWLQRYKTEAGVAAQIRRCPVGANLDKVKGYRILSKEAAGEDEVYFSVYVEGLDLSYKEKYKRIGSEWKFDGEYEANYVPGSRKQL